MRKHFLSVFLFVFAFIIFLLFAPTLVVANHQASVLGAKAPFQQLTIPSTIEGPGIVLPDSPFFFLDEIKQGIRLSLSFTPEEKAKVYKSIAGERFAELRYMLTRNNKEGIGKDLESIAYNLQRASEEVANAQYDGKDVKKLAKIINDDIKSKQDVLDNLAKLATGRTKTQVLGVSTSLFEAKTTVEHALGHADFQNEIRDDLRKIIQQNTEEYITASQKAQQAAVTLEQLTK